MYEGEWTEKNYAVSGDVLDGVSWTLIWIFRTFDNIAFVGFSISTIF